jgi:hypothetical protein
MRRLLLSVAMAALIAGCGGGSGGVAETGGSATLELAAKAATAETVLYAVEVTVRLPAGVTVDADPATGELAQGTLQSEVKGALVAGKFVPATATTPATVKIALAYPSGFTAGGLAAVSCRLAPGTAPNPADFVAQDFSARDANGRAMTGVAAEFSLQR